MWRFIVGHSIYQLLISFIVLYLLILFSLCLSLPFFYLSRYAGSALFNVADGSEEHYTIVFNVFVFMQLFNEINSRKLEDGISFSCFILSSNCVTEKNPFEGIFRNKTFLFVFFGVAIVQVLIVEFGGRPMNTHPLSKEQWLACIIMGAVEIPIGIDLFFLEPPYSC